MKKFLKQGIAFVAGAAIVTFMSATPASAIIVSVGGASSSAGGAANVGTHIGAPAAVLDDFTYNTRMEGFDEAQGVTTSTDYSMYINDARDVGTLATGTRVDSHMIFLNNLGNDLLTHEGVRWEFSGMILGVMGNSNGSHEAASSAELGAASTNYDDPAEYPGSGGAAPFAARGLETGGVYADLFSGIGSNYLTVSMFVTEPGDWIRVVTVSAVPLPAALPLYGAGIAILGLMGWRKRRNAAA